MNTIQLREELHEFINKADDRLLNLMYALIRADIKEEQYELSEAQKQLLEERLAAHEANPTSGSTWEEVKARIQKKL